MNKTIFHIEDDADDREMLFQFLKKEDKDVQVEYAENGLDALTYLKDKENDHSLPCLIVLDLNMPYLDGKETFNKLQAEPALSKIPVVIFTSSENPNDKELFASFGVEFITKPNEYAIMDEIASRMVHKCMSC